MGRAGDRGGPHLNATRVEPSREGETFDRLVREGGDFNPFADRGWDQLGRRFGIASGGRSGLAVLDIGCGTGRSRRIYAAGAGSYTGLDLSFEALRAARLRQGGAWTQADACRLPFAARTFDVAAFSSVLHHIPDRAAALAEARRVLRPDGLLFAFDPNVLHPAMALFRHPRSPLYTPEGVSPHERPVRPSALRREIEAAGFSAVRQRCQSDIPYRAVAPRLLNALLGVYNGLDRLWELAGFGRRFGAFVVSWGRVPADAGRSETRA